MSNSCSRRAMLMLIASIRCNRRSCDNVTAVTGLAGLLLLRVSRRQDFLCPRKLLPWSVGEERGSPFALPPGLALVCFLAAFLWCSMP